MYEFDLSSYDWKLGPLIRRGIRTKDWLYVRERNRPLQLFDQNADRGELVNLAYDPEHAEILAELDAQLLRNMDKTGDAWELACIIRHQAAGPEKSRQAPTSPRQSQAGGSR